jgi:hypothetical protein
LSKLPVFLRQVLSHVLAIPTRHHQFLNGGSSQLSGEIWHLCPRVVNSSANSAMTVRRALWRCKPSRDAPRSVNTPLDRFRQASSEYQSKINFTCLSLKSVIFPTINMESFEDLPDADRHGANSIFQLLVAKEWRSSLLRPRTYSPSAGSASCTSWNPRCAA